MGAALPPDSRYVTGNVPAEMREGVELTPGVEVAPPTEIVDDVDGAPTQITRYRVARPDHIPAGAPKLDPVEPAADRPLFVPGATKSLRYDFPLFPDVQCRIVFEGPATADHLDQLCEYLTVARDKLREQQARAAARPTIPARSSTSRKIKPKKEPTTDGN